MGEEDNIELIARGRYVSKGSLKYLIYREYVGNTQNYNLCIIKIEKDNLVTLTKRGNQQIKLVLEKDKKHDSPYYTDYGVLMMSIFTHEIESNCTESKGKINIKYSLDVNSSFINMISIIIEYKKLKSEEK